MSDSHANENNTYIESLVQVQPSNETGWHNYGNSFPNIPTQEDPLLVFDNNVTSDQGCAKIIQRNTKKSSTVDRSYYCNECGGSFSNSSNLKSHARIHSGERPYICDVCGVSFVQSSNMKAHKRIHTGERPYTCTECGQTFSRSSHLTGHKRTHTGERPYICGVCNESFVTSTHLRNHMRKHTGERPFVCEICKSSFAQNGSLQIHLRIHTGERPYKCANCTSAFRSKGDLRSHHKLHTEFRLFSCGACDKTFKTKQYLQKHRKKCGAPPTGKKRGRPKKVVGSEMIMVSSKTSDTNQILSNIEREKQTGSNNNAIHIRVKDVYKLAGLEQEISSDVFQFDILKNEDGDQIPESNMNHIIGISSCSEGNNNSKQPSFYQSGDKNSLSTFHCHSNSFSNLGNSNDLLSSSSSSSSPPPISEQNTIAVVTSIFS